MAKLLTCRHKHRPVLPLPERKGFSKGRGTTADGVNFKVLLHLLGLRDDNTNGEPI